MEDKKLYYTKKEIFYKEKIKYHYQLNRLIVNGVVEKVAHNLYVYSDEVIIENDYYVLQKNKDFLYSHTTSAYFQNLTTRDTDLKFIVVKTGTNVSNIRSDFNKRGFDNLRFFYVKKELYDKMKDKVFWGDSYINVVSYPYLIKQIVKEYDNIDKWVALEILNNEKFDKNKEEVLLMLSKKLKTKYQYLMEGLK